ncbi:hypothetical protein D9_0057 [Aeromonas phage D9]|nr:hypothetical protein D9_0057 [Aeromonas phage D9]
MYDEEDSGILPQPVEGTKADKSIKKKDEFIAEINRILNKTDDKRQAESELVSMLTKQRALLLDVAMETYISKPSNCKLLDSINTLTGLLEKTIRDERKERAKEKEAEDNRANFATFVNALNEVAAGKLVLPNYGDRAMILDPLKPIKELSFDERIKEGEIDQGVQEIDISEIEATF